MTLQSGPLHVFVPISDGDRAISFYRDTLGLSLIEDTPFAVVFGAPGGQIRCAKTPDFKPQPFTVMGWQVRSIADEMASLAGKGVAFERFAGLPQNDAGVWETPDGAKVCWFKDPDGNVLSLMEPPDGSP